VAAVGRPSNAAGASDLADLLDGLDVLVVGERDGKPGGRWPGRDGAKAVARQLAGTWDEPVHWTLPAAHAKDIRAWLTEHPDADGAALYASLEPATRQAKPTKRSTADRLVELAEERYRLGLTDSGEAFAVGRDGPSVAMLLRGGASALRANLARMYRQATGKPPNATALADAVVALEGKALDAQREPVALRVAGGEGGAGVVLDLGEADGAAVVASGGSWRLANPSPVLFRRTALTGPLPEPAENVSEPAALLELRNLLNVTDDAWPLVVGWLVASMLPDIPHPVLMLGGEQGTGKSTAARLIVGLVDPSPALLRSEPRDPEAWAMTAAGSWCVVIDNVSRIPSWWSDAICKAVTGDGWVRRKLYTDSDLAVLTYKRCVVLTSIDAGALRGDLGDRLMLVDLERIDDERRRTEAELDRAYTAARPRLLAGLLSAVARTLVVLPEVQLDQMPRMADFARVLAAVDRACPELTGGRSLELFAGQRKRIAADVVEADEVAAAVVGLVDSREGHWNGTAGDLLRDISPDNPPKGWPANARAMSGRLKRVGPALRQVGIELHKDETRSSRGQTYRLEKAGPQPSRPSPPSLDAAGVAAGPFGTNSGVTVGVTVESPRAARPSRADVAHEPVAAISDGADGRDGTPQPSSKGDRPRRSVRI
jgi:hypothetical protein